jgi:hypothetical protein
MDVLPALGNGTPGLATLQPANNAARKATAAFR